MFLVSHIHMVPWPVRRDLQRELAEMMLALGAASTAFDLFSAVELWDEAAECLMVAGKEKKVPSYMYYVRYC